jgi:hypothetical protein
LPERARDDLARIVHDPEVQAAVWRLAIDADDWWFRAFEWGARVRDRIGLPYGDQGLLVRTPLFEALGGFPDYPVMEDVALVRRVQRATTLQRLSSSVVVSARRWRKEGPLRTLARNAALITAYLFGVPPDRLARWYPTNS